MQSRGPVSGVHAYSVATDFRNPADVEIAKLLRRVHNIAVVGMSADPTRPSHGVARAMQGFGFRVVPVNPNVSAVLGETAYADLAAVPDPIDLVDVFRRSEHVDAIVDSVIARRLPALWLQEGVIAEQAAQRAQQAGVFVVMNRCVYREYLRLIGPPHVETRDR